MYNPEGCTWSFRVDEGLQSFFEYLELISSVVPTSEREERSVLYRLYQLYQDYCTSFCTPNRVYYLSENKIKVKTMVQLVQLVQSLSETLFS
jgi:hypothetical protein